MAGHLCIFYSFFLFKQKTAYEMRISDWSSDVGSSDLVMPRGLKAEADTAARFIPPDADLTALRKAAAGCTSSPTAYSPTGSYSSGPRCRFPSACMSRSEERRVGKEWFSQC